MSKLHGYITLKELSQKLGYGESSAAVQRLRRQLKAKEKRCGQKFLIRLGEGVNSPLYVTESVIRQFCPELINGRDEMAEMLRDYIRELEETIVELKARDRALGSRIRANRIEIQKIMRYVDPGSEVFDAPTQL